MRFAINKLLIHFTHPTHTFYTSPYLGLYSRPPIRTKKQTRSTQKCGLGPRKKNRKGRGQTDKQTNKQTDIATIRPNRPWADSVKIEEEKYRGIQQSRKYRFHQEEDATAYSALRTRWGNNNVSTKLTGCWKNQSILD